MITKGQSISICSYSKEEHISTLFLKKKHLQHFFSYVCSTTFFLLHERRHKVDVDKSLLVIALVYLLLVS